MNDDDAIIHQALRDSAASVLSSLRKSSLKIGLDVKKDLLHDPRLDQMIRTRIIFVCDVAEAITQSVSMLIRIDERQFQ